MRILNKGKCTLEGLVNNTSKTQHLTLSDGNVVIAKLVAPPGINFTFGMHCQTNLKISGKGSRGAYFDGFYIRWPEE